jgi:hypothetical protein
MKASIATIVDLRQEEIDGRPQLVIDLEDCVTHQVFTGLLDRDTAMMLTEALGPHPLVEKFFGDGKGLQ